MVPFSIIFVGEFCVTIYTQMIQDGVADLHCRSDHYLADEIYREYTEDSE